MSKIVEIIAQNVQDAINAQKGGAKRIELVSALSQGGLTPSIGMIQSVLENTSVDIAVMLRPTSYTFCYDRHYLEVMRKDVLLMQMAGVKRVVLGILDYRGEIDFDAIDYVMGDSDMQITFHRAIDSSSDIIDSVKKINDYPRISHILTSGGYGKAVDNIDTIKKMLAISKAKIMIGSGLNLEAIDILKQSLSKDIKYDIHFGSYVQDDNKIVDKNKVKKIVDKF